MRFKCKAKTPTGRTVNKIVTAANYAEACRTLETMSLTPVTVTETLEKAKTQKVRKMSLPDLVIFCQQIATMLSSGIPLVQVFDILYQQAIKEDVKELSNIYGNICGDIQNGSSLKESLESNPGVFPNMVISMVEAGEISGNLELIMRELSDYYDKTNKTLKKVNGALTYPKILLCMIVVVVIALFTFILPPFFEVFEVLDIDLPTITVVVIAISDFFISRWWAILLVCAALVLAYTIAMTNEKVAFQFDYIKTRIPVVSNAIRKMSMSNFASTMGLLYASGVDVLSSLEICISIMGNKYYRKRLTEVKGEVEAGKSLSSTLEKADIFEPMLNSLILVGEESGNTEAMMGIAGDFYDAEAQEAIQKVVAMVEPIIIVIIGILVLGVVAAVMIPTFSMASQIV